MASLSVLFAPAAAAADPRGDEAALVLPTSNSAPDDAVPDWVTTQIERSIALRGTRTFRPYEAAERFAATHSKAPIDHDAGALEQLHACAARSLVTVATGHYSQARTNAAQCIDEAERALESINREARAAEDLLNSCLYVVRALIGLGQGDAAKSAAHRCRVMVPDLSPSGVRHPPEVVALVESVDQALAETPHRLIVESTESGCGVYLNGRRLGSTPLTVERLHAGAYRVQVECDPDIPGRVHDLHLSEPEQTLVVDARYERSVRTTSGRERQQATIALRYDTPEEEARMRVADAIQTGTLLHVEEVWLVERELDSGTIRVDRVAVDGGEVLASGRLALSADGQGFRGNALGELVVAMERGASLDLSGDRTARMTQWTPPSDAARWPPPAAAPLDAPPAPDPSPNTAEPGPRWRGARGLGLGLAIAGGAGLALGVGLWVSRAATESPFDRGVSPLRVPQLVTAAAGAALLSASVPLWLPESARTPLWSYALGAAGLVAIGAGVAIEAREEDGGVDAAGRQQPVRQRFDLGYTLMTLGAPLLSVPITQLARGARFELDATASRGGASLRARGRF